MNKNVSRKIIPYALLTSIILSGCGKKSNCEVPSRHVHRYTKQITEDISIEKYLDDERLVVSGYNWDENYIEITKNDEELYHVMEKNNLFEGKNNWEYLYNVMASHPDYLEFYYYYITIETYTTVDEKGNVNIHTKPVTHSGWTTNAKYGYNTGDVRIVHTRYYGYRIVSKNGKLMIEKSEPVDDIRDIISEYPYFKEDCTKEVYEQFKFEYRELPFLSPNDFDVFIQPDLVNRELENGKIRARN